MATYQDLQTRIITETNRDDLVDTLASQLALHIASAIEFFADHRFWFNEGIKNTVCVPSSDYIDRPSGLRFIDRASISIGAVTTPLTVKSMVYIDDLATVNSVGQPNLYAEFGAQIRLWPQPVQAYPLAFIGIVDLTTLANPPDSNAWTTEAYDLIANRTKHTLFRDQFMDGEAADKAAAATVAALNALNAKTAKRTGTGRVTAKW